MKTATIPPVRVAPEFRMEVEEVLEQGETLSEFVENAIRQTVLKRQHRAEFLRRGIAAIEEAKHAGGGIAADDLERLFDFILQRELESETGDLDVPDRALRAIKNGIDFLRSSPFACRKVGGTPFLRELVITFGSTGFVALYEIVDNHTVIIGAI